VAAFLTAALANEFDLTLGAEVTLEAAGDGVAVVAGDKRFEADMVLAAVGRRPNLEDIGLETLGVPLDDRGMPEIDPTTLQVGDLPVWIAGDANGALPLLHEAADEDHIAGRNAMADKPSAYRRRAPLAITFSAPCAARVGRGFAQLDPETAVIGAVDFARQGRARTAERAAGVLRVYAERKTGRLLGAEMACPSGEHMAHLLALALSQGLTVSQTLGMPFYHPVLEEGLRTALRDVSRRTETRAPSDLSACPAIGCDALD
jgi:dihydrolipoamide dehydrogenase